MCLSIVEEYFSVNVTIHLRIALMNNTPPKRFYVDFIHLKYCFQFDISAWNRLILGLLLFISSNFLFQIIISQCCNYDINVSRIIWLPFFPVE